MNRLLKMAPCLVSLLLPLAALAESQPVATEQHAQSIPRIATVDWTVAETLLALINNTHYRYDEEDLKSELVIRASA